MDMRSPTFIASIIASVLELQLVYPDIKEILVDGQSSLSTVKAFHPAVVELTAIDKRLMVINLLEVETRQISNLRNIFYHKVRESRK